MKILLFIVAMFFAQIAPAKDARVFVVIQRTTSLGTEQNGFVFEDNKIKLTSNSNFLTNVYPFHFGLYEVSVTPEIEKKITDVLKTKKLKEKEIYLSPHDLTIFVNGERVPANSVQFGAALSALKMLFESKTLKLIDGVTLKSKEDLKKISCEEKKDLVCTFKYGYLKE